MKSALSRAASISAALRRPIAEWDVLFKKHEGYITWDEFERNQRIIADMRPAWDGRSPEARSPRRSASRRTPALRHCGRNLQVHYSGKLGRYNCYGARMNHGTARCISLGNRKC